MDMETLDNVYQTKDLGEITALVTLGCIVKNVVWKTGVAYFCFDDPTTCQKYSQQYFFDNLPVNSRLYYENLRMIKRKIIAEQTTKGGVSHVPNKRPRI